MWPFRKKKKEFTEEEKKILEEGKKIHGWIGHTPWNHDKAKFSTSSYPAPDLYKPSGMKD